MNRHVFATVAVLVATTASAQTAGSVSGVVTDATGAVLPGVTVSASGPSLMIPREQTTGARGGYSLSEIPIGRYAVRFELNGFKTLVYQDVVVEAGGNVTLDAVLEVARVTETVTVTGEAPMVDGKSLDVGQNVDAVFLREVPSGRDVWAVLAQTPGVVLDRYDVGGLEGGQQSLFSATGTSWSQNQYTVNGTDVTDPTALGATTTYYSYDALEEIRVSTSAHPAEIRAPGVSLDLIIEKGGNDLRGGGAYYFEAESLQSYNLDAALRAQGVAETTRIESYYDYHVELGGPLARGRAWFYGHRSGQHIEPFVLGFFLPDFEPGTDPTDLGSTILRGSFQVHPKHRLEGLYFRNTKLRPYRDAGRARPTPAAALYQDSTTDIVQVLYTALPSERMLFDARFGVVDMVFPLGEQPDLPADAFSRIDLATGIWREGPGQNPLYKRGRYQGFATLTWFRDGLLGGSHDLKLGGDVQYNPSQVSDRLRGSILYRDFLGVPVQVELYNDPVTARNRTFATGLFVQDRFTVSKWALSLGLRLDLLSAGYPEQVKVRGPWDAFFAARGMPTAAPARSRVARLASLAPRLGLTYSPSDDGRTLLRASYSRYAHQIGTDLAGFANPVARASALFDFEDRDHDRLLDPDEIDFDSPIAVNLPSVNEVDPDLALPLTDEITLGIERQMGRNLVVGARIIYRKDRRLIDDINVGVAFDRYEPVTVLDPGLDLVRGTSDDRLLTLFNQDADTLGQDRTLLTNPEDLEADYRGLMIEARKRFSGRWQMLASLTVGKSTGFLPAPGWETTEGSNAPTPLFGNPNTLVNARGRTFWDRTYVLRASGSLSAFWGIKLGAAFRFQSGQALYRSIVAARTIEGDPLNQGAIEVLADPQGFARHPSIAVLDGRLEKEIALGRFGRLGLLVDVFNLLNANTVTEMAQRDRSFGAINRVLAPRILRIGARYHF